MDTIFLDKLRKNLKLNIEMRTIFWDIQNGNGNYILGRREYLTGTSYMYNSG